MKHNTQLNITQPKIPSLISSFLLSILICIPAYSNSIDQINKTEFKDQLKSMQSILDSYREMTQIAEKALASSIQCSKIDSCEKYINPTIENTYLIITAVSKFIENNSYFLNLVEDENIVNHLNSRLQHHPTNGTTFLEYFSEANIKQLKNNDETIEREIENLKKSADAFSKLIHAANWHKDNGDIEPYLKESKELIEFKVMTQKTLSSTDLAHFWTSFRNMS